MNRQPSLFGDEALPRTAPALVIGPVARIPLTKAQQAFNRLVRKIEKLRARIARDTEALNGQLEYYVARIRPVELRVVELRKTLARCLSRVLREEKGLRGRRRQTLREVVAAQLAEIVLLEGDLVERDLQEIFAQVEGLKFEDAKEEAAAARQKDLESLFEELGMDVDFSFLRPGAPPQEAAERFEQFHQEFTHREGARPRTKATARRQAREAELAQARKQDLGGLYRQLAKLLHPDLELSPVRKQEKEALMQQLNAAYKNEDLHTLLRLELEWIQREENDLARLTEEKLMVYNEVLKEQVKELEDERAQLPAHPRYAALYRQSDPGFNLSHFDGSAAWRRMTELEAELKRLLGHLQGPDSLRHLCCFLEDFARAWSPGHF